MNTLKQTRFWVIAVASVGESGLETCGSWISEWILSSARSPSCNPKDPSEIWFSPSFNSASVRKLGTVCEGVASSTIWKIKWFFYLKLISSLFIMWQFKESWLDIPLLGIQSTWHQLPGHKLQSLPIDMPEGQNALM